MSDESVTQTLKDQLGALRGLARQLVRDPLAADDAVQDTCVAALTTANPPERPSRGWLRTVLTNAVRQRQRSDARRRRRELAASGPDHGVELDPTTLAADLGLHRRLLSHVAGLPAPYRHVVTLRFWRGCSHPEIAATLGITVRLSHERLSLALAQLRADLDREPASREHWRAVFLGWLAPHDGSPLATAPPVAATTGWFLMQTKALVAASLTLAVVAALTLWAVLDPALEPPAPGPQTRSEASLTTPGDNRDATSPTPPERRAVPRPPAIEPPSQPAARVHGMVADIHGRRLAGVLVTFEATGSAEARAPAPAAAPSPSLTKTDANGMFELPAPTMDGSFATRDPEWATVRRHLSSTGQTTDPIVIVAAPARNYAGVVVDPENAPVSQARIVIDVPKNQRVVAIDGKALALPHDLAMVETDAAGRFAFRDIGWLQGARLTATRSPFGGGELALPEFSANDLVIRMSPPTQQAAVHGLVLDSRSRPVEGALVAAGGGSVRTDATGRFRVLWPPHERPQRVSAVAQGHGSVATALREGDDQPGWHIERPILLQFAAAPHTLRGRVIDEHGQPVAGAKVWTPDLTYLGQVIRSVDGHQIYSESSVEEQYGKHNMLELRTTSAIDGTFELKGVLDRRYAMFAMNLADLRAVGPIAATPGVEIELVLPQERRHVVAGRVVANDGTPLANVQVRATRELSWQRPERHPDPWQSCPMLPPRPEGQLTASEVRTDEHGRFELPACVIEGTRLRCFGDAVYFARPFELSKSLTLDDLEIRVPARSTFRIILESMPTAEAFTIRGTNGRIASVMVATEGLRMSMARVSFADGISPTAWTAAGEFTLVLLRGETEMHRQRIVLPPGGIHEVRL